MKLSLALRRFLLASTLLAATNSAYGQYWDNNDSTNGFGTAGGTWGTDAFWNNSSTGVAGTFSSATTTSSATNFGTAANGLAAGTITVGTVQSGNMTFGSASGALILSGGTISYAAGSTIAFSKVSGTGNVTISSDITTSTAGNLSFLHAGNVSGTYTTTLGAIKNDGNVTFGISTGSLTQNPATTFRLAGASTYTGTTNFSVADAGRSNVYLILDTDNGLSQASVLQFGSATALSSGRQFNLNLNGYDQTLAGMSATSNDWRLMRVQNTNATAASLTINDNGNRTFAGMLGSNSIGTNISFASGNNFNVVKNGTGTWTLNAQFTGGATNNLAAPNSYTGGTIINQGGITLGAGATLGSGSLQVNNTNTGAGTNVVLTATASDLTVGSLSGTIDTPTSGTNTATINTAGRTFTVNQTAAGTYAGTISGAGNFTLGSLSTNKLTLTGDNSYSGATTISAGTLEVSGATADINQSSGVTIASGAHFKYNSSTALTTGITNNGGTISGTGDIGVSVGLNSTSDILAPGNSPGIQEYTVGQTWASFTYQWEIDDFNGTVGADFDQIQITGGGLVLTGNTAGSYIVDVGSLLGLVPGDVPNFSETTKSWEILTATGGITGAGFDTAYWNLDTSGFTTALNSPEFGGSWSLSMNNTVGTDSIFLTYTIPEPRAALLGGLGLLFLLRRRRQ